MNEISQIEIIAKEELDIQIVTAKKYPRDIKKFMNEALELATADEETAESCLYCLRRKDKNGNVTEIKGKSIRLAEIVMACWGNLYVANRIVENDGKHITAQGAAFDLERNVRITVESKRSITTASGATYGLEMQAVTANAAASIALRNAIFKVVPNAITDRIYKQAVKVAVGDQKKIEERRKQIFERYKKLGIEPEKIFKFFNKEKIDDFTAEDLESLIGIGTSIKDRILPIDRAFVVDEETVNLDVEERVKHLIGNKETF